MNFLLQENGDYLLQENGGKIIIRGVSLSVIFKFKLKKNVIFYSGFPDLI
jgi:hypothetical protein